LIVEFLYFKEILKGLKMLILSRKKDERIVIGKDISIMVVSIDGNKVRLGIDAPKDVEVDRQEIRLKKDDSSYLG
jgi:carbon storage regulator